MKVSSIALILTIGSIDAAVGFSFSKNNANRGASTCLMMSAEKPRVVVTGLGVISGCGVTADSFFESCVEGKSSLAKVTRFDAQHFPCQIASEVPDDMFDPKDHFANSKNAKTKDQFTHFSVASSRMALKDGRVGDTPDTLENPDRLGVMVGTAFGGVETFEQQTLKLASNPERPRANFYLLKNLFEHGKIFSPVYMGDILFL
mmetsp:Transcript_31814/g.36757  ORF Transcript_31814/g.36757 Transcript_31814/m.36757 type:complete len:203 (+) Transcript_31814:65-673(+)